MPLKPAISRDFGGVPHFIEESTSGLDYRHMKEVAKSINRLRSIGKTQFIITHDPELVASCCDYFIFMENGKVTNIGSWTEENIRFVSMYFSTL